MVGDGSVTHALSDSQVVTGVGDEKGVSARIYRDAVGHVKKRYACSCRQSCAGFLRDARERGDDADGGDLRMRTVLE